MKKRILVLAMAFCLVPIALTGCGNESKPQEKNMVQKDMDKKSMDKKSMDKKNMDKKSTSKCDCTDKGAKKCDCEDKEHCSCHSHGKPQKVKPQEKMADKEKLTTKTFSVEMFCEHCQETIEGIVSNIEGIKTYDVSLDKKQVTLGATSEDAINKAKEKIEEAGYKVK